MIVATFSLPHDALALGQTFQELLELKVEAERIAAHSRAWVMPYLWATNAEFETADEVDERIDTYVDQRGSVLDTEADADEWQVRIRFVSRDQFDAFRNSLTERGMRFELRDLTEPDSPRQTAAQLTPDQRDALVVARELGYYEVPRRRLTRNASEPGISHRARSERLRRGAANLIGEDLTTEGVSCYAGPDKKTCQWQTDLTC